MRPAKDVIINESLEELRKLQQKLEDSKSRLRIQFLIYIKESVVGKMCRLTIFEP